MSIMSPTMKLAPLAGLLCAMLAGSSPATAGASYNCSAVENVAEHTVCINPELAGLDRKMAETYFDVRRQLPKASRRAITESQRNFLRQRDNCGADYDCLKELYELRIVRLSYYL